MLATVEVSNPGAAALDAAQAVRDAARRGREPMTPQVEALLGDIEQLLDRLTQVARAQKPNGWRRRMRSLYGSPVRAIRAGDAFVQTRPWATSAIAVVIGGVLGAALWALWERADEA